MQFQCPKCSGVVSVDNANLGKTVSCGHCKEIVNAPQSRFDAGVIINDFIIEREVGIGGMGVVYLAKQITLDRYVALKILKEKYAKDTEFIVQFVREARSAAKLNHPNIVQAYAVGEEDGIFFFAMEYVDGETMKEVLAREGKIDPQRASKIIRDIAIALDYAWTESKIVHHDIKPDNIMITKNGKAKLADLGLASMFGDAEVDDSGDEVLGTPQYISPEQLLGDPTDVRSDIYSLGATFFHFVTGTFAYIGATPTIIAHQHVNGVFQPAAERNPSVPGVVSDIITKMMQKDINLRYQSADELAKDLKTYLDNSGFVSTASVPLQMPQKKDGQSQGAAAVPKIVTLTPPAGGLKFSSGGAKPISPAAPVQPAHPVPSADNSKTSAPVKPVVPVLKAPGSTDNKTDAPKPAAPVLKAPGSADNKTDAPKPAAIPKAAETEKKTAKPVAKAAAKAASKNNKSKEKKQLSPAEKKKIKLVVFGIIALLLIAFVGAVVFCYKMKYDIPPLNKFRAWNEKRLAVAKQATPRIHVPKKKEPSIEEIRKDYIPQIEALKKFYTDNPSRGGDFMKKFDEFIQKHGLPELEKEKAPFAELSELYNAADEKVYMAPGRASRLRSHEADIKKRISGREAEARRKAQLEAERRAQEARAEEARKAEIERQRREQEAARLQRQKLDEYRERIAPEYNNLAKMFYESIFDLEKEKVFFRKIDNLLTEYPTEGLQFDIYSKVAAYGAALKKELPQTRRMYAKLTENTKRFIGYQFGLDGDMVEIISLSFPKKEVIVRSLSNHKRVRKLSLDNEDILNKIVTLLMKKFPREKADIKKFPFYYHLFFGNKRTASGMTVPGPIWKEFFRYYL